MLYVSLKGRSLTWIKMVIAAAFSFFQNCLARASRKKAGKLAPKYSC